MTTYLAFKLGEELVLAFITSLAFSVMVSLWATEKGCRGLSVCGRGSV